MLPPSLISFLSVDHLIQQDDTLHDLARKYNATLESIALQTLHILDSMNSKGHEITSIYMSGGQAKNIRMMQLFADTCGVPVVLPFDHAGAVVLGAAMLGRFAAEVSSAKEKGDGLTAEKEGELLWEIMVRRTRNPKQVRCSLKIIGLGRNDAPGHKDRTCSETQGKEDPRR